MGVMDKKLENKIKKTMMNTDYKYSNEAEDIIYLKSKVNVYEEYIDELEREIDYLRNNQCYCDRYYE